MAITATVNKLNPLYVACRITERAYGGPEEGGWYYDAATNFEGVQRVYSQAQLDIAVAELTKDFNLKDRGGEVPSRWDSAGCCEMRIWYGQDRPVNRTKARPHYE